MSEVAKRAVFVVGVDGKISYKWVGESLGELPPFDDVKAGVQDLT
jgi:peroxiredoxin